MTFSTMGKEVLSDGAHFADAMSPDDAERIADALNATSEDVFEPDGLFFESKFWRAPDQVCERVPAGKFQTEESEVMREPAPFDYWTELSATAANSTSFLDTGYYVTRRRPAWVRGAAILLLGVAGGMAPALVQHTGVL